MSAPSSSAVVGRCVDCQAIAEQLTGDSGRDGAAEALQNSAFIWSMQPSGCLLAVGFQERVCLAQTTRSGGSEPSCHAVTVCRAPLSVTALCWAAFPTAEGAGDGEDSCLLVGTSSGHLHVVSPHGELLQRQRLHSGPLLRIRCRAMGMGTEQRGMLEDITLTAEDAVLRISAIELLSVLRGHRVGGWTALDVPPLTVGKWRLPRLVGPRTDAFCAGAKPPALLGALTDQDETMLCIQTAGSEPALASLEAREQVRGTLLGSASKLAYSMASTLNSVYSKASIGGIYQMARSAVKTAAKRKISDDGMPDAGSDAAEDDRPGEMEVGEKMTLWRSVSDPTRTVTALWPSPAGSYLASTDQLGRVLLLDGPTFCVVHMWKGYRDAACGWVDLPAAGARQGGLRKLHLVIHAPRKAVVEIWPVAGSLRRCAFRCSQGCKLLQPEAAFQCQARAESGPGDSRHTCYLMDPMGGLVDVRQHAQHALR